MSKFWIVKPLPKSLATWARWRIYHQPTGLAFASTATKAGALRYAAELEDLCPHGALYQFTLNQRLGCAYLKQRLAFQMLDMSLAECIAAAVAKAGEERHIGTMLAK